ncbi:MAG TPA: class I SAM-dependent methyltransferase [Actinomycetota bacterium]
MSDAIERIENPEATSRENLAWHLARYRFAASLTSGGDRVLDAATGIGYGVREIAEAGGRVVACDVARDALGIARARREPASFFAADLHRVPCADASMNGVVAFEVIEHLREPAAFLDEVVRLLAPGGWFVVSTPNPAFEVDNPFHEHELPLREFTALLTARFSSVLLMGQSWSASMAPAGAGSRLRDLDRWGLRKVLPQSVRDRLRSAWRADGASVTHADLERAAVRTLPLEDANPYVALCR